MLEEHNTYIRERRSYLIESLICKFTFITTTSKLPFWVTVIQVSDC